MPTVDSEVLPNNAVHPGVRQAEGLNHFSFGPFVMSASADLKAFPYWPLMSDARIGGSLSSYPFQCRDHIEIWMDTIGSACNVAPYFVSVSDEFGNLIMLLPLGIQRMGALRALTFLDLGVCDYNAPVLFGAAAQYSQSDWQAAWKAILRHAPSHDIAILDKIPEYVGERNNPLYDIAQRQCAMSGYFMGVTPAEQGGVKIPKAIAADSQRQIKRLSKLGKLHFEPAVHGNDRLKQIFEDFVRQKVSRYRETGVANGFDIPGQQSYYLTIAQRLVSGGAQLSYFSVGDEIVATHWGLVSGGRFYYMMPAYKGGAWSKFSPGRLLLEELLRWCERNQIGIFDFGIGDEAYKLKWRPTTLALREGLYPRTPRGHFYQARAYVIENAKKTIKKNLPRTTVAALKSALRKLRILSPQ